MSGSEIAATLRAKESVGAGDAEDEVGFGEAEGSHGGCRTGVCRRSACGD